MEQPSVEAVPRHQGIAGQRAATGAVSTQQVAQSSDIEGSQLHRTAGEEGQLRAEEEKLFLFGPRLYKEAKYFSSIHSAQDRAMTRQLQWILSRVRSQMTLQDTTINSFI